MKTYNGHPSYDAWNVSLWINNDEGLYNLARDCKRRLGAVEGARAFVADLQEIGQPCTGDGVRWTVTNVMRAMRGL